jgi:hypothetical protein
MRKLPDNLISSRKVGSEDIIMLRLPTERFRKIVPSHYDPMVDDKSRYQVALLVQDCDSVLFNKDWTGPTHELHLWLQIAASNPSTHLKDADIMLRSVHWFSLASATSNDTARSYLQSFGFSPQYLEKIELAEKGGSLAFPDGGRIEWTTVGPGKAVPQVGVHHVIFVAADGQNAVGHRVTALLSNAMMEQRGRVHIQTAFFEPFLLEGDELSTVIHRMHRLEADIVWRQLSRVRNR